MHIGRREGNALLPGAGPRGQQHFALDAGVGAGSLRINFSGEMVREWAPPQDSR